MAPKGKEVIVDEKSQKRGRPSKTVASSSAPKAGPARRFGAKEVEPHGLTLFNTQKEENYVPENWIDEGRLALSSLLFGKTYVSWGLAISLMSRRGATSLWEEKVWVMLVCVVFLPGTHLTE
ncbi:hypothetical protein HAX54_017510, partial [Datura stramonium]|nr:hypothetical protein [Datura stramonium]